MYELNRIVFETRDRAARREGEAAAARIARRGRAESRRRRRRRLSEALRYLRSHEQESLEAEI